MTLELLIGLGMALAMHAAFRGQGLLRTTVLVPWAVLTVVTAVMWRTMFVSPYGFVNTVLGTQTVWLGSEPQALIVIILADVWKTAPFMALLILAGLQVIPGEVYEAAEVDGASTWQRFTRITLPLLTPAILVALIFRTLDALRIFDLPYVLTQGQNGTSTLVDDRAGDVRHEPDLRARLGHGGADVHRRDDRLLLVHPLRRREPSRTGGGVGDGSWSRYRTAGRNARACEDQEEAAQDRGEDAVVDVGRRRRDRRLLPVPVLLADQHLAEDRQRPAVVEPVPAASRRSTNYKDDLQEPRLHQGAAQQRRRRAQHDRARAGRRVVLRLRAGAAEAARASS